MKAFFDGLRYFITGFGLIFKPGLRWFVWLPAGINMLLFMSLFFIFKHYVVEFNQWFYQYIPTWLHWLSYLLWLLFFTSFFLLFIYSFITVGNIIAAPFNSLLAEKVECYLTCRDPEQRGMLATIKDIPRMIARQIAIVLYYLPRAIILLLIFFIPVIQAIAAVLWLAFNAWYLCLTYLDFPADNHRIPLKQLRAFLHDHRALSLGFGTGILLAAMVPVVNFFVMPAAVAGAVKLWLDEYLRSNPN